jgi:hypothetical protein
MYSNGNSFSGTALEPWWFRQMSSNQDRVDR